MKTPYTLIAAIDFTPYCRAALRQAVRLAAQSGGKVVAIHVMDAHLLGELKKALATTEVSIRADWESRLREFIAESEVALPEGSGENAFLEVEVRIGHPAAELAEACRVYEADLLVMGVMGEQSKPHRVGAIAAKCVRMTSTDVLLVSESVSGAFKCIVACVDFSPNSAKAVEYALRIAKLDGASLDCLHVYQSALALSLDYGGLAAPMPVGADSETLQSWNRDLEEFVQPLISAECQSVPVTLKVLERVNIREAIVDHVIERQADLVVLGTRGKTGLRELLIGTTAEKVVSNAHCSTLAVKPDEAG